MNTKPQEDLGARGSGYSVTGQPITHNRVALDVRTPVGFQTIGTVDAVESWDATTNEITATAHQAAPGDSIRFTSGDLATFEFVVHSTTANTIKLACEPQAVPQAADAFVILRPTSLSVGSGGALSQTTSFNRDGITVEVTEDTVTPANNLPLPVKLMGTTGEINITAGDLNVQNSHTGANPDSIQIGDGTETLAINASNEAQVADDQARTSLSSIDTKVTGLATETTLATLDGKVTAIDTGNVTVVSSALPTGAATAVNQATANSTLGNIDTELDTISTTLAAIEAQGEDTVINTAYNAYASNNLPGNASLPLELVASTSGAIRSVQVFDTAGVPCELMLGAASSETRLLVFGPGADTTTPIAIAAGQRVSIRRLDAASAVAVGDITINFIG